MIRIFDQKHPGLLDFYKPIDPAILRGAIEATSIRVDPILEEIYHFTNGFGIFGYCLAGIKNKKIADLVELNSGHWWAPTTNPGSKYVDFLGGIGEHYAYIHDSKGETNQVVQITNWIDGDYKVVALSLKDFFEEFFLKMEQLAELQKQTKKKLLYIDDLPGELAVWEFYRKHRQTGQFVPPEDFQPIKNPKQWLADVEGLIDNAIKEGDSSSEILEQFKQLAIKSKKE
jgi:hypothetical protein